MLPDPRTRPWLTVDETAAATGEGVKAIRAAIRSGVIPSLQVGRYVRVPTAGLWRIAGLEPPTDSDAPDAASEAIATTTDSGGPHATQCAPAQLRSI